MVWAQSASSPRVRAVAEVDMTVSDMDRAVDFYTHVLHFRKLSTQEVSGASYEHLSGVFGSRALVVHLELGDTSIELTEFLAPRGRPIPLDAHSNDRSFQHIAIIVRDMDAAYAWLRQNKVDFASSGPQRLPDWNPNAAGIRAFYFKDPDGHPLEVLAFPPDKGLAKWHRDTDELFLGIDHTAIVVHDTDASLRFYRDTLGMRVVGTSDNYGTEQEHLNSVFGAHLRITSLRAGSGPGVELLEYLAPGDGRPFPPDERANDILHRQTVLLSSDLDATARELLRQHAAFVSSGGTPESDEGLDARRAFLVRDPDGHVLEFAEERP
jgi:catechol 2,3-dioxygenase-like lactoylglutathione lyase family enzyme